MSEEEDKWQADCNDLVDDCRAMLELCRSKEYRRDRLAAVEIAPLYSILANTLLLVAELRHDIRNKKEAGE